jgi:ATP-dependent Lon protease
MDPTSRLEDKKKEFKVPSLVFKLFVFFPGLTAPIVLSREKFSQLFEGVISESCYLFVTSEQFFTKNKIGTLCEVVSWRILQDKRVKIILRGLFRASLVEKSREPFVWVEKLDSLEKTVASKEQILFLEKEVLISLHLLFQLGKIFHPTLLPLEEEFFEGKKNQIIHLLSFSLFEQQELLELEDELLKLQKIHKKIGEEITCANYFCKMGKKKLASTTD